MCWPTLLEGSVYFEIVKQVVEQGIADYAAAYSIGRDEVLTKMKSHIDHTQKQHYQLNPVNPDINYDDPLCRLGYLYRHAGINATLFERVLKEDQALQTTITDAETRGRLRDLLAWWRSGYRVVGTRKVSAAPAMENTTKDRFHRPRQRVLLGRNLGTTGGGR